MRKEFLALLVLLLTAAFGLAYGCAGGGGRPGQQDALVPILSSNVASFVSAQECRTCHSDKFGSWSQTMHALAFDVLIEAGSEENPTCLQCHTVGYGSGGFVNAEETPQFFGVQCESCHGSGVNHAGRTEFINVSASAAVCGQCHNANGAGPIYEEWQASGHGTPVETKTALPYFGDDCLSCHSADYILAPTDEKPHKDEVEYGVTCATCHNPHSLTGNEHQLRYPAEDICLQCHLNESSAPNDPDEDYPYPHQTQGNIYLGEGGYVLTQVSNSTHTDAEEFPDRCVECHQLRHGHEDEEEEHAENGENEAHSASDEGEEHEENGEEEVAYSTHDFTPKVPDACQRCHTGDSAESLMEFTQSSTQARLDALSGYFDSDSPNYIDPDTLSGVDFLNYSRARFNYDLVEHDESLGVHNANYARALLDAAEQFIANIAG